MLVPYSSLKATIFEISKSKRFSYADDSDNSPSAIAMWELFFVFSLGRLVRPNSLRNRSG